jgi:hypothetical protein
MVERQKEKYENYYRALFNIQTLLADSLCIKLTQTKGTMNGFDFNATCSEVIQLRNYQKAFEAGDQEGNIGPIQYTLYQVSITFQKEYSQKTYTYYKTVTHK